MANGKRGEVTIEVEGKRYTLHLTTNAMCALEDLYSTPAATLSFQEIAQRVARGNMRAIRAMCWAALQAHHPDMSIEDAGRLIDTMGMDGLGTALTKATGSTAPDEADLKELGVENAPRNPRKARAPKT